MEENLNNQQALVLALDVGGTYIKSAVVSASNEIRNLKRTKSPQGEKIESKMLRVLESIIVEHRDYLDGTEAISAIGLTVPGVVDADQGIAVFSENIGWHNFRIIEGLRDAIDVPIALDHDVTAMADSEYELFNFDPEDTVLIAAIGTGISGVIFNQGRPFRGNGFAGEFGHIRVASSRECGCGGIGCLEAWSSASAIGRIYSERTGKTVHGAQDVLERKAKGDKTAIEIWNKSIELLAYGIQDVCCVIGPDVIVIGGGLSEAGEELFSPLEQHLKDLLLYSPMPKIYKAKLGENAGILGASMVARRARMAVN